MSENESGLERALTAAREAKQPPAARWEYKTVRVEGDLQWILDTHATDGWRFVQTYQSMGYTVQLIFERTMPQS